VSSANELVVVAARTLIATKNNRSGENMLELLSSAFGLCEKVNGESYGFAVDGVHHNLRRSYLSPNHQEFGLRIGSPMFNARSPLTHLMTVHTTHQSKIRTPTAKWSVRSPKKKYRRPIQNVVI
jgi:hypothetical protein